MALNERFRTSTRSGDNGSCVEVALLDTGVVVRDSKDRQGPVLGFDPKAWTAFVTGLKSQPR